MNIEDNFVYGQKKSSGVDKKKQIEYCLRCFSCTLNYIFSL